MSMKIGLLLCTMICGFFAGAQIDLKEKAKSKLEQQDFNTTRNNKDRNNLNSGRKKSKKMQSESAPPPPPPAPAPDTLKDLLMSTKASASYKVIGSVKDFTLFIGTDFAIIQTQGEKEFTVYDFGRSRMITFDTIQKKYQILSFEPKMNRDLSGLKASGKTKLVAGIEAEEYLLKDAKGQDELRIWVDAREKLLVYWYDMTFDLFSENEIFSPIFFLNQGNLVLEMQEIEKGKPANTMQVTKTQGTEIRFDLRTYQRL